MSACRHCRLRLPETCLPGPCPSRNWQERCEADPDAAFVPAYASVVLRSEPGAGDDVPRDSDSSLGLAEGLRERF